MTLLLCRLCPKPAHFNFREGILLCAECAADILKLCEISSPLVSPSSEQSAPADGSCSSLASAGADQSTSHKIQNSPDQQSQDQAKHEASINPGVVVAVHDGIPNFLRRTA